jgi:hypothetical protein
MRTVRRVGVALLLALALTTSVSAQSFTDRISLDAAVGPSFANVGTTFSTTADLNFTLNDRTTLVGEFGWLRHAPFEEAANIAPAPVNAPFSAARVNGYHWNANVEVKPFTFAKFRPYVTGGLGTFTADTIVKDRSFATAKIEDRRRVTDFSTNVGGGVLFPVNDWLGVTADYRTFFVHRDDDTPRVHRLVTGLTFLLK